MRRVFDVPDRFRQVRKDSLSRAPRSIRIPKSDTQPRKGLFRRLFTRRRISNLARQRSQATLQFFTADACLGGSKAQRLQRIRGNTHLVGQFAKATNRINGILGKCRQRPHGNPRQHRAKQ